MGRVASQGNAARLKPAYRFERSKWIYVHLEGSPADIGYQHGYLLAPEIADGFNVVKFKDTRRTKRDWDFFRDVAEDHHLAEDRRRVSAGAAGHRRRR